MIIIGVQVLFCFTFSFFVVVFLFFILSVRPILRLLLGTELGFLGAPAALYRYTSLCLHAQTHQK